jgi:hypothetical protein
MSWISAPAARASMQLRRLPLVAGLAFAAEIFCAATAAADEFAEGPQSAWHLAVVDGELIERSRAGGAGQVAARPISVRNDFTAPGAVRAQWSLQLGMVRPPHVYKTSFGPVDGLPLSGDFNGDGMNEMAMFVDGRWYVDFNGNSHWDAEDLCVALGGPGDRPIVGDWNGDGKDDLGLVRTAPVNRADVILAGGEQVVRTRKGHAFSFGPARGTPVVGDWTNTGVDRIGVFADGVWTLDIDGDRRFTQADAVVRLGNPGDAPIVGDFNRDGRDDLGIYRNGTWQIDTTGDLRLGPDDLTYQLGDDEHTPVVGDWDGDGRDQIGVVNRAARGSRPPSAG